MAQPGLPGSQFPGDDDIPRQIRDLRRDMQQFNAANILATIAGSYISGSVAHALDSDRTDHADGVTPEAFAREVAGVPGSWYAMYMHSNGTMGRGTSSIRYKKNVRDFALTTDQIMALRPVLYDRKAAGADEYTPAVSVDELGLIAEEVEQVAPELVEYYDGVADNVKYPLLGVGLLPVIQQLLEDNAALKQAVRDLGGNV